MTKLRQLVTCFLPQWPGFKPRLGHVGFVVDKAAMGPVYVQVLWFPLPSIPPTARHSSSRAGTISQMMADLLSELNLTPPQETKLN
jgi:hypothetical protein